MFWIETWFKRLNGNTELFFKEFVEAENHSVKSAAIVFILE